jgi:hypothetical protein
MAIAGINLTKIICERKGSIKSKISVRNNVVIKKVDSAKIGIPLKEKGITIGFGFSSSYAPEIGKIEIEGNILILEPEESAKKIMEIWDKSKKLPPMLMQHVFTAILRKCNIKALILAEDVGLPSPIRLPEVKVKKVQKPAQDSKQKAQKK